MAKIMFSVQPQLPIFFNLDANVGERCPNRPDDVALVSYMMRLAGKYASDPAAKRICMNTQVTNTCTPALIQSIKELQAALKVQVDGHVSVANSSGNYSANGTFLIARFNYLVKAGNKDFWPRIDRIPDAPTPNELNLLIQRQLIGADA